MNIFLDSRRFPGSGVASFFILQGALLVLLGVLIVMFPALLRVMVAAFFIGIGILVLGFGLSLRRMERRFPGTGEYHLDL